VGQSIRKNGHDRNGGKHRGQRFTGTSNGHRIRASDGISPKIWFSFPIRSKILKILRYQSPNCNRSFEKSKKLSSVLNGQIKAFLKPVVASLREVGFQTYWRSHIIVPRWPRST
jgi:hypothetical protein